MRGFRGLMIASLPAVFWFCVPAHGAVRLVTLAPSLGELAAALLDEGPEGVAKIVGVSDYSDFPPSLRKIESVGPYHHFHLEKVVALKPDLVLATLDGNSKDQVDHLREQGVRVQVVEAQSFDQIEKSARDVGASLGLATRGNRLADAFHLALKKFREVSGRRKKKRRVLLQLGDRPLVVAGARTFLHEALGVVGATNAMAQLDVTAHYPRPSIEEVLRQNPEVILILALGNDGPAFEKMAAAWKSFPQLDAVRNRRVRILRADALMRPTPTPRMIEGLRQLEEAIYDAS